MRFLHSKVKANKGGIIRVHIDRPTRVLVMTGRQFKRYRNNQTFTYYGGEKDGSYEFTAPTATTWHVIVEKGSYANPIDISARVEVEKGEPKRTPKKLVTSFDDADKEFEAREEENVEEGTSEESDSNG